MKPRDMHRQARREEGRDLDRDVERRVRSLEFMRASQLPIDPVVGLTALDVQTALEALAAGGAPDVQAILDQISTTRGSILYRGAADWLALGPGASGEFLRTNGVGADPTWSAASGGGGSLSLAKNIQTKPPRSASFPFSIGSPVVTQVSNALYITGPTSGTPQVRAALKTAQASPFSVIVRFRAGLRNNFNRAGIVFTDGTKYLNVGPVYVSGGFLEITQFSNSTTFNSATATVDFNDNNDMPDWFKADANPSTGVVSAFYSWDGVHWISMGSSSTYLSSITQYGLGVVSDNVSVPADASFTYYEDGTVDDGIEVTTGGGGGGGGGGSSTLFTWDGAIDPVFATSAAIPLDGIHMLQVIFSDVTMATAGWRVSEFSFDGGTTWENGGSNNYTSSISSAGIAGAAGTGTDSSWFLHSTASNLARSAVGVMWGLNVDGIKRFISNRNPEGIHLNRSKPTHVRIRGWLTTTTQANFTGGRISVVGYTKAGGGGGGLAASFETVSKNLPAENATFTYSGGNLTSIAYANGITKTFNYSGGNLTSVVLSGSTPGGIDLTKTLAYTGSDLTSIAYSP